MPFGAVVEGEIVDPQAVGSAISELWRQTGFRSKDVAIGLANQKVVVRLIDLPFMEKAELQGAIQYQAQDYIPIPVEEAILSYDVIGDYMTPADEHMMEVLLVAASREVVERGGPDGRVGRAQARSHRPHGVRDRARASRRRLAGATGRGGLRAQPASSTSPRVLPISRSSRAACRGSPRVGSRGQAVHAGDRERHEPDLRRGRAVEDPGRAAQLDEVPQSRFGRRRRRPLRPRSRRSSARPTGSSPRSVARSTTTSRRRTRPARSSTSS